jgi:hypothetical protein
MLVLDVLIPRLRLRAELFDHRTHAVVNYEALARSASASCLSRFR